MKRLFAGTAMLAAMAWLTAAEVAAQQGSRPSGGTTTTTTTTGTSTSTGNSGTRTPTPGRDTASGPNSAPPAGLDGPKLKKTTTNDKSAPSTTGGAGTR